MQAVVAQLQNGGGGRFAVLDEHDNRLTVTPENAAARILDTEIVLPVKARSIDEAIQDIIRAVGESCGVDIQRGGIADSELMSTIVVLGDVALHPAREYLSTALDSSAYGKFWVLTWEPSSRQFYIGIQTAVKLEVSPSGVSQEAPVKTQKPY